MSKVGQSRLRTGGCCWRLYRSGEDHESLVEQFTVPSWAEFGRQHTNRWLASDHQAIARALAYTVDGRGPSSTGS
jgi:hypothetical protein